MRKEKIKRAVALFRKRLVESNDDLSEEALDLAIKDARVMDWLCQKFAGIIERLRVYEKQLPFSETRETLEQFISSVAEDRRYIDKQVLAEISDTGGDENEVYLFHIIGDLGAVDPLREYTLRNLSPVDPKTLIRAFRILELGSAMTIWKNTRGEQCYLALAYRSDGAPSDGYYPELIVQLGKHSTWWGCVASSCFVGRRVPQKLTST